MSQLPADIPPDALPFLTEMGYLEPDRLHVGATVPPLTFTRLADGSAFQLDTQSLLRPVVLIFGSYT